MDKERRNERKKLVKTNGTMSFLSKTNWKSPGREEIPTTG
jgi:hypothetical protein